MKKYFCNNCDIELTKDNFAIKDCQNQTFCSSCAKLFELKVFPENISETVKKERSKQLTEFRKKYNEEIQKYLDDCNYDTLESIDVFEEIALIARLKKYNINLQKYYKILNEQKYCCAICGKPFENKTPSIDHNHKTGKVRGFLCSGCNLKVGLTESIFHNNIHKYLDFHEKNPKK